MKPLFASIMLSVALASPAVIAADAAAQPLRAATHFAVPEKQVQALGIRTAPLQKSADAVQSGLPAQVIVPPNAEQIVSSPLAGLVTQLLVQQNQTVRAGTPLLRIVSPELGQWQLQLLQAAGRATLARQAAQRERQLFDEGIIPQRRVQEAETALSESEAVLHQSKAALRLAGMPAATIEQIAASGKPQDSIALMAAKAGVVTEIEVKPGQRVEGATPLMHVVQTDTLWLDIQVPVRDSANWKAGSRLMVRDRDVAARVLNTASTVAGESQTVGLRAAIEGKTGQLRPGEFVTVDLPLATTQDGWTVPLAAVAHDGNQAYVFVRTADGFDARPVNVAASAGQSVRIQGALKAGDTIAVAGVVALKGAWFNARESK